MMDSAYLDKNRYEKKIGDLEDQVKSGYFQTKNL